MAEEAQGPAAEGGPDAIAVGAALGRASGAVDAELIAYLHDQRHHMHEQLSQMHLDIWEKKLGVALRLATLVVGVVVAAGLGLMVWDAAHSDGLKVEPFSVPPVMAERGLTGQVVAARVIDRLSELQSQTNTARPARSYSNAWGEQAIKLEIPETGVSLGELNSWLREAFGHETALTGEVVRNGDGVTLTARTGEDGAVSVSGSEADMDALTGKLAEAIYRLTQPYRYASYLLRHEHRAAEAAAIFKTLALGANHEERRWSYNMWAMAKATAEDNTAAAAGFFQQAHDADPSAPNVYVNLSGTLLVLGRYEEALHADREWLSLLRSAAPPDAKARVKADNDQIIGAFHDALPVHAANVRNGVAGFGVGNLLRFLLYDQRGEHDYAAAQLTVAAFPDAEERELQGARTAVQAEAPAGTPRLESAMAAYLKHHPHNHLYAHVYFGPPLALVQAHLGDFAGSEKTIAPTPGNCLPCVIARAEIAELRGQRERADWWFNRATAISPSLPFAFEAEGRALLGRGQPDGAAARFIIANQKSPHFADPLEGWGEALMAKNHSDRAAIKFLEAEQYAPNWGRLHLKWGEALVYTGHKDEARKQFAQAASLDLTPSERSELLRWQYDTKAN